MQGIPEENLALQNAHFDFSYGLLTVTATESRMQNKKFNSWEKKKAKIPLKDCNKWKEESSITMNTKSRGKWAAEDQKEKPLVSSCQYSCLQSWLNERGIPMTVRLEKSRSPDIPRIFEGQLIAIFSSFYE